MLRDPASILLWAVFPAASVFALGFLRGRFTLSTPRASEQPWGCREVSLALVFAQSSPLLFLLVASRKGLLDFVGARPWTFEGLLFLQQMILVAPAVLLICYRKRALLQSVGLIRSRAISLGAAAAAGYLFLVSLWSVLRLYLGLGWSGLYTNAYYGPGLYRIPVSHGLALVADGVSSASVEEVVFRGFALLPIARVIGPAGAIAATALFWGMGHFDPGRLVGLFPLGLLMGWMFYRTGSLVPSLTFHVLVNLGASSDFAFGRLRAAGIHWTDAQHFLYIGVGSLGLALLCGLLAFFARRHDEAGRGAPVEGTESLRRLHPRSVRSAWRRRPK